MSAVYLQKQVTYSIYRSRRDARSMSTPMTHALGHIDVNGPKEFDWYCNGYHGTAESLSEARVAAIDAMKKKRNDAR